MPDRFTSSGLANSAADALTASTGEQHRMAWMPRHPKDQQAFVVVKAL